MHEEVGLQTAATYPVVVKDAAWEAISAAFNEPLTEARVQAILAKLNPGKAIDPETRNEIDGLPTIGDKRVVANQFIGRVLSATYTTAVPEAIRDFVKKTHETIVLGMETMLPTIAGESLRSETEKQVLM